MSRFWKKFFLRVRKQLVKVFWGLLVIAVIILAAIIWISTGVLFAYVVSNFTPVSQEHANTLGILFVVGWPFALVWVINTAASVKSEIEKENEKILHDIKSSSD